MNSSDDIPASDPHRDEGRARKTADRGEAAGFESEAASASKTRRQIRELRWAVTAFAVFVMIVLLAIIVYPILYDSGRPPVGLETYLYIITGVAPVAALTTILAVLLVGVFRGFHGKDMDDGLGPAAVRGLMKGAGGSD